MAVKIKLKRLGKIRAPYYRIVVADARTKRDGRPIEEIGKYHPKAEPSLIEVDSERAQHWLSVGAQPTPPVRKILEVTGDWQKFKGLAGTEGTLRTAGPKADKKVAFAAAVAESLQDSGAKTKSRGKASDGKAADAKAADAKAADGKAGDGKAADAKAGDGKAADAKASRPDRPARGRRSEAAAKDSGAAKESGAAKPSGAAADSGAEDDSGVVASEAAAAETPAAEAPAAEAAAAEAPAAEAAAPSADEATAEAEPAAEGGTESAGDGA